MLMYDLKMKNHEYQSKKLLKNYNIKIQDGLICEDKNEIDSKIKEASQTFNTEQLVIKAQIHAGGRGKGGGVKFCPSLEKAKEAAHNILGMQLITPQTSKEGQKVRKIFIAEALDIEKEYYFAITLDRSKGKDVIMASTEGVMKQIRENHPTYWNMPYFCETFELPSALNGTMSNSTASSFNNIFEVCDNHSQDMFLANLITSASFTIASRLIWRCFGNIPVEDPNEDRPFQTNIVIPRFVIEFLRYIVSIAYFGLIYFVNVMIDSQIKENNDRDVYLRYWLATPFYFCFFNYIVINDELSSKSVITVEELTVGDNPCLRFLKGKLYKREIWPFESKKNEEHKNVGRDNKVTLRHLFIRNSFLSLLYSILISELIKEYANNYKDGTNYVIIASLVFYSLSSSIDYFFNVWDDKNFESEKVNTDDFNNDLYNV